MLGTFTSTLGTFTSTLTSEARDWIGVLGAIFGTVAFAVAVVSLVDDVAVVSLDVVVVSLVDDVVFVSGELEA